jgi:hypothetical protein
MTNTINLIVNTQSGQSITLCSSQRQAQQARVRLEDSIKRQGYEFVPEIGVWVKEMEWYTVQIK